MSDKQTQCKQIVAYIREKGCITSLEAYQELKVTQLAAINPFKKLAGTQITK